MDADTDQEHSRIKEKVAFISIIASIAITLAKGIAGFLSGSLALISDAANSLLDIFSTSITWMAIRKANKPADESHHYGHGKIESVAALFETVFLFFVACIIAYEGIQRLLSGKTDVEFNWISVTVMVFAIITDFWRWRTLKKTAEHVGGSDALEADALHFAADLVNSVLVLLAIGAVLSGYFWADAVAALLTALFMLVTSLRLALKTVSTLIDTAPKGIAERMKMAALSVSGVVGVTRARVRTAGGRVFADILIQVSRTLPLEKVNEIKKEIITLIRQDLPGSDVEILAEGISLDNESIMERIMLIAAKRRLFIHHITVQDLGGRICVGLDLEVDGRLSISAAHRIATKLEDAIYRELGPNLEVDTHIEPLRMQNLMGADEREAVVRSLSNALKAKAHEISGISEIHHIRVRRSQDGLIINYHCLFDPVLTVSHVHALIDELEWRFRLDHPDVIRVIGHAEPFHASDDPDE